METKKKRKNKSQPREELNEMREDILRMFVEHGGKSTSEVIRILMAKYKRNYSTIYAQYRIAKLPREQWPCVAYSQRKTAEREEKIAALIKRNRSTGVYTEAKQQLKDDGLLQFKPQGEPEPVICAPCEDDTLDNSVTQKVDKLRDMNDFKDLMGWATAEIGDIAEFIFFEGMNNETFRWVTDVVKLLQSKKDISVLDCASLSVLASSYYFWKEASRRMVQDGATVVSYSSKGDPIVRNHPQQMIYRSSYQQLAKTLSEFGLTLNSRVRIQHSKDSIKPPEDDDDTSDYLK